MLLKGSPRERYTVNDAIRLLSYIKRYWYRLTLALFAAALYGITAAFPVYALKHLIDDVFIHKFHHYLVPLIGAFVVLFAAKGAFMFVTAYYMHWVGNKVVLDIRSDLFDNVIKQPLSFFQKHQTGSLLSCFMHDVQMIQDIASAAIKNGLRSFFEALFLIGFAFTQNWQLACMLLLIAPLLAVIIRQSGKKMRQTSQAIHQEIATISALLQEIFIGIRDVKAFGAEHVESDKLRLQLNRCFKSVMRYVRMDAGLPALIEFLIMAVGGVVLYSAIHQVLDGTVTAGQLTSFLIAVLLAYQPLKRLIDLYGHVQYALGAARRIFALMDHSSGEDIDQRSLSITNFQHTIELCNVSFSYDQITPVLNNINVVIKRGQVIGIVGPSGSGKSTLCDLLLGFITPSSGSIFLDGINIAQITHTSLRERIGYVGQRAFLFADTIYNNIIYPGVLDIKQERVYHAARRAYAQEFIEQLPDGYQTYVGENGSKLSGGQKQRLTIARALLKDTDILIFDEATSALDPHSESLIKETISLLRGYKTMIIVSHRTSFLSQVDQVLKIEGGKII